MIIITYISKHVHFKNFKNFNIFMFQAKWVVSPFLAINTSLVFFLFYGKANIMTNVLNRNLLVNIGVPQN